MRMALFFYSMSALAIVFLLVLCLFVKENK